jgi:hypothetical protein
MARISKTICDGCGFTEDTSEGTRESMYPTINRISVRYGYSQTGREADLIHKGMELCQECQVKLKNTINLAMLPENLKGDGP